MSAEGIHVGTSGWTYDDWSGRFYPPEVKGPQRLAYYATRFEAVEINATFYRLPTEAMISAWNRRLPEHFHLVVKGSRAVTHLKKLRDCRAELDAFLGRALRLIRLKVILWQLPPSLHKDIERLDQFLSALPTEVRHAVEFRHPSWWDQQTAGALARHHAAFAAISHPRLPDGIIPTADFLYVRFHGLGSQLYRYDYSPDELAAWAERLRPHMPDRELYAFFNNDYEGHAPANATAFRQLLSQTATI